MARPCERELREKILGLIAEAGGTVVTERKTGHSHNLLIWTLPNGETRRASYASSFRLEGRTFKNTLAMFKRMCRIEK